MPHHDRPNFLIEGAYAENFGARDGADHCRQAGTYLTTTNTPPPFLVSFRPANRKPVIGNLMAFDCDESSLLQIGTVGHKNARKQLYHGTSIETLEANSHDRGAACSRNGQHGMEIRIQCDHGGTLFPGPSEDLGIGRSRHLQLADVCTVVTQLT